MENPDTKLLIKKGINIIRELKLLTENNFKIADKASEWIDLSIEQLSKMGEDDDTIKLLGAKNLFYGILFPSFHLSEQKNKKRFLNNLESFINELIERLIKLKDNKDALSIIYINKSQLFTITNGKKISLFKHKCKREEMLREIILKKSVPGVQLLSTYKYKEFSALSKEISGINNKNKLIGLDEKIIEHEDNYYYLNKSIKIIDQS